MRLRNIPIETAFIEYAKSPAGHILGDINKLPKNGKTPVISSYYETHRELESIGNKINELIEDRNMLVHGLIIKASSEQGSEGASILHNGKMQQVSLSFLDNLIVEFTCTIEKLNSAVPTGHSVEWVSCGSIEMTSSK